MIGSLVVTMVILSHASACAFGTNDVPISAIPVTANVVTENVRNLRLISRLLQPNFLMSQVADLATFGIRRCAPYSLLLKALTVPTSAEQYLSTLWRRATD